MHGGLISVGGLISTFSLLPPCLIYVRSYKHSRRYAIFLSVKVSLWPLDGMKKQLF